MNSFILESSERVISTYNPDSPSLVCTYILYIIMKYDRFINSLISLFFSFFSPFHLLPLLPCKYMLLYWLKSRSCGVENKFQQNHAINQLKPLVQLVMEHQIQIYYKYKYQHESKYTSKLIVNYKHWKKDVHHWCHQTLAYQRNEHDYIYVRCEFLDKRYV